YLDGGAGSEAGVRRNERAFDDLMLKPSALVNVETRDLSTSLFGRRWAAPFGIAPIGLGNLICPRAEEAIARAAAAADVPYTLSTARQYQARAHRRDRPRPRLVPALRVQTRGGRSRHRRPRRARRLRGAGAHRRRAARVPAAAGHPQQFHDAVQDHAASGARIAHASALVVRDALRRRAALRQCRAIRADGEPTVDRRLP